MKIVVFDGYTANPGDISWNPWNELGDDTIYYRTAPSELLGRAEGADAFFDQQGYYKQGDNAETAFAQVYWCARYGI